MPGSPWGVRPARDGCTKQEMTVWKQRGQAGLRCCHTQRRTRQVTSLLWTIWQAWSWWVPYTKVNVSISLNWFFSSLGIIIYIEVHLHWNWALIWRAQFSLDNCIHLGYIPHIKVQNILPPQKFLPEMTTVLTSTTSGCSCMFLTFTWMYLNCVSILCPSTRLVRWAHVWIYIHCPCCEGC